MNGLGPTMPLTLRVNGRAVSAVVEPRLHLADFLRDELNLTGTHLGCEHGVCGACTLLVDGEPIRSCIAFAGACDGADVTTIEGLDKDEIAIELRAAFNREHAVQCGFCTPGMLISARDLVLRPCRTRRAAHPVAEPQRQPLHAARAMSASSRRSSDHRLATRARPCAGQRR